MCKNISTHIETILIVPKNPDLEIIIFFMGGNLYAFPAKH